MTAQLAALVLTHLSDRRRSLLAWGLPLGLWSAFIVADLPLGRRDALAKAVQSYPSGLKEAFGIGELSNVEQYLHAEMLSLIVPLALGYLAVRAVASGLTGAAESGRLDVLLSAPVSRVAALPRRASPRPRSSSPSSSSSPSLLTALGSLVAGADLSLGSADRRLRQRLAAGPDLRRPRRSSPPASRCAPASSPARSPGCW